MKFSVLLSILFDLLSKRKATARELAEKYAISPRTVYRYVDVLATALPVSVKRGRDGGICLSDSFRLPVGFLTSEEYEAILEALERAYAERPEERFLNARRKLTAERKTEKRELALSEAPDDVIADFGVFGSARELSEKLRIFEDCVRERLVAEIVYEPREGDRSERRVEPHVLVQRENVWYVYAFCHTERDFRLYPLGHIPFVQKTEERFQKRILNREDIPLDFGGDGERYIRVRLEIGEEAVDAARMLFGTENVRPLKGNYIAELSLPDGESLVWKLLSLGTGIKVLTPPSLCKRLTVAAKALADLYKS